MHTKLVELVGGLSLATDMGAGQPLQSAIVATILATRLGRTLGLAGNDLQDTFYSSILRFIGCSSSATEAAQVGLGDDNSLFYSLTMCDFTDPAQVEAALERYLAPNAPPEARKEVAKTLPKDMGLVAHAAMMHCAQAVVLSKRLPVGPGVVKTLGYMYDRFDGKMSSAKGTDIPMPARIACLAADTAVLIRSLGKASALEIALSRKGGQFCPEICDALAADHATILAGLEAPSCWDEYLECAPSQEADLRGASLEEACTAYADYGDQKSGFLLGHSRRVARLTYLAAGALGVDEEGKGRLRLAAMLHDVGRAGVPSGLWDKRAPFTGHERQLVESHNAHTETILNLAPGMRSLGAQAAQAHERSDRSGYPRATPLGEAGAGLLAAADVYEALTHDRPWRRAHGEKDAAKMLLEEAKSGRLPRRAVEAVLDAAGHTKRTSESAYPKGLSRREAEVLALLAQGLTTKEIGERLSVAAKTAENHISSIYEKTGARGRAAAALFAVEHGLHESF